jgi:hypothetical protein
MSTKVSRRRRRRHHHYTRCPCPCPVNDLPRTNTQTRAGCKFPCNHAYRKKIQEYTLRVGRVLADKGAMGHFGVDFLASCTASAGGLARADSWYRHTPSFLVPTSN